MSGISYGKTAEQAGLEFLSVLADPASYKDKITELKKTLELVTGEQNKLSTRLSVAQGAEAQARNHRQAAEDALAKAAKLNADTEDRRAEIARRQDEWERNLNVRETELRNAEASHAAEIKRFEIYKAAQSNDLEKRMSVLATAESDHGKRKAALDKRETELNAKAKAAADLVRALG